MPKCKLAAVGADAIDHLGEEGTPLGSYLPSSSWLSHSLSFLHAHILVVGGGCLGFACLFVLKSLIMCSGCPGTGSVD